MVPDGSQSRAVLFPAEPLSFLHAQLGAAQAEHAEARVVPKHGEALRATAEP